VDAAELVAALGLEPHPEGGHYRETWRAGAPPGERSAGTAIYYLLQQGEVSRWHRIDSAEIWHWYAGAPLHLEISADGKTSNAVTLGQDIAGGQRPQVVIPPGHWQSAQSRGAWTLVGCTVSPGFEFECFELAPASWKPG
jgi:hypothetical protein